MPFQKRKEMRSVSPSSDLSVLERGGNAVELPSTSFVMRLVIWFGLLHFRKCVLKFVRHLQPALGKTHDGI
jgi:hypothetical protein